MSNQTWTEKLLLWFFIQKKTKTKRSGCSPHISTYSYQFCNVNTTRISNLRENQTIMNKKKKIASNPRHAHTDKQTNMSGSNIAWKWRKREKKVTGERRGNDRSNSKRRGRKLAVLLLVVEEERKIAACFVSIEAWNGTAE